MNKLFSVLFVLICTPFMLFAQKTLIGKVIDESGNPVSHANVQTKSAKKNVETDKDGNFTLTIIKEGSVTISVSSVGYNPKAVTVSVGDNISIQLEKKTNIQDEVIVVGYQTIKRGDLNGATSSVTAGQIRDNPASSGAEALTGRAAGVNITSSEGGPGADYSVKLRGGTSITQDNNPLYIVDGVAVDNALSLIAPQDIQSFDVLKDAAATAIYGARGANGVIVITTKSGKLNNKLSVSYSAYVGWKEITKELDVLDPYNYVKTQYELMGANFPVNGTALSTFIGLYGGTTALNGWDTVASYKNVKGTDWQQKILGRKALQQSHNLSLSGGNKNTSYNLSFSLNREQGVLISSDFNRKVFSAKVDHKASDKLKMGTSVRYNNQTLNGAGLSGDGLNFSRLRHIIKYNPLPNVNQNVQDSVFNATGSGSGIVNPLQLTQQEFKQNNHTNASFNGYVNYDIKKWLSFKTTVGIELDNQFINSFSDSVSPATRITYNGHPLAEKDSIQKLAITNSNVLTYSNQTSNGKFKQRGNSLQILIGQETNKTHQISSSTAVTRLPYYSDHQKVWDDILHSNFQTGAFVNPKFLYYANEYTLLSFFSKINYNYNSKYIASFTYRADGSSKFAPGHQWGYFPSASLGWKISKENFMKNVSWISDLKLRATYGQSGNNRVTDYTFLQNFLYNSGTGYGLLDQAPGTSYIPDASALANENLTWETTTAKNIGLDVSLFHNYVNLTVDIYRNVSNNLLLQYVPPLNDGYNYTYRNLGASSNQGLEIQLGLPDILQKSKFKWSANFNISFNRNRVESIGDFPYKTANSGIISGNDDDYYIAAGQPLGQIYGYVYDGFYKASDFSGYDASKHVFIPKASTIQYTSLLYGNSRTALSVQPGDIKFKDLNGDGIIDQRDKTVIGNTQPKFFGGLNQQFNYKGFDMSIFVNFVFGNDVFNANKLDFTNGYQTGANMLGVMKNRWTTIDANGNVITNLNQLDSANKNAKIWFPSSRSANFSAISWAVEDGSFLRINNITLGYTFKPKKLMKSLRVYATVNNVAILTSYSGYDPEVDVKRTSVYPTPGVDYSAYPKSRSYLFGVNVNF